LNSTCNIVRDVLAWLLIACELYAVWGLAMFLWAIVVTVAMRPMERGKRR
jgi:hypothetical protein